MQVPGTPAELTYCLNVHPGATLSEMQQAVFDEAPRVFDHLAGLTRAEGPFGVGLWLSAEAALQLNVTDFKARLADSGLYVFTLNGFPYGPFHGQPVKQQVYRPDWSERERLDHTLRLAYILAELLPAAGYGTISTVPITYRAWAEDPAHPNRAAEGVANLMTAVLELHHLHEATGKRIQLALEPEPDCFLQDTPDVLRFYEDIVRTYVCVHLSRTADLQHPTSAKDIIDRHLGICLDLIHVGVAGERPATAMRQLAEADVPVAKVQIGAALTSRRVGPPPPRLHDFEDEVYLHQTRVERADGSVRGFPDLPEALAAGRHEQGQWRVHYHVPTVWDGDEQLASTRDDIDEAFFREALAAGTRHFEVETYTLGLFPDADAEMHRILARELAWTLQRFPDSAPGDPR